MSVLREEDPLSPAEPTQPSPVINPAPSTGEAPAEGEHCETTGESGKGNAARTRPEVPDEVYLSEVYVNRHEVYTQEQKAEAWSSAANTVKTHSDETIKRWKEEIDNYLTFAGLFSAVLTTFNVQSYLLLQPAAPDPSIAVLQQISSQLASYSISPPFVNSTQPSSAGRANANTPPPVPRWAVWLNVLWFSGLILSLTSASIGIMVKQWLNEYSSGVSGTSRPAARLRQYRLQNLRIWHVEDIVNTIPVLLQLALALFLAGLLILLWNYNNTVAAIASTLVGLLAVFTVITTLLPLFDHACSYLTPQIRAINSVWQPKRFAHSLCASVSTGCCAVSDFLAWTQREATSQSVSFFNPRPHRFITWLMLWGPVIGIESVFRFLGHTIKTPEPWKEHKQTWQGRERSAIDELTDNLDKQTLLGAYNSTLHPDALSAATVCLMDLPAWDVVDYFQKLHRLAREHFGPAADLWDGPLGVGNQQQLLWLQVILCTLRSGSFLLDDSDVTALRVYFETGWWSSSMQADDAKWAVSTLNALMDYLEDKRTRDSEAKFIDQNGLQWKRTSLIDNAIHCKEPLTNVVLQAVPGAYRQVRLKQEHLKATPSDDAKAAHMRYLKSVDHFLECANHIMTSSLHANDLETVCAYMRDVLAEVTHTLLEWFTKDRMRTVVHSEFLYIVVQKLCDLDDTGIEECIPDELVQDISDLAEKLIAASEYYENYWVDEIQQSARIFKANLVRVKRKPRVTTAPKTHPPRLSPMEPVVSVRATGSAIQVDGPSGTSEARDPQAGGDSQAEGAASSGNALPWTSSSQ